MSKFPNFDQKPLSKIVKIAYSSDNNMQTINEVMEYIGKTFGLDRVYINELSKDESGFSNTYFWEKSGKTMQDDNILLSDLSISEYYKLFDEGDVFAAANVSSVRVDLNKILNHKNMKSVILCNIKRKNKIIGFVGFDTCYDIKNWTDEEVEQLSLVSKMLGNMLYRGGVESKLQHYNHMQQVIFDSIDAFVFVIDPETYQIKFFNREVKKLVNNIRTGDVCYKAFWNNIRESHCEFCPLKSEENGGKTEIFNECLGIWTRISAMPIIWTDNEPAYLVTSIDITEQKNNQNKLKRLAYFDSKLGIGNRENCIKNINKMFNSVFSPEGVMLEIDIDDFKNINDSCGYHFGDKLLKAIVEFLQGLNLGKNIYRVGGDEFIIILSGYDADIATICINKIFERFEEKWTLEDIDYKINISMAMLKYPEFAKNSDEALSRLDDAMLMAKNRGKKQLVIYDDLIGEKVKREGAIKDIAERALINKDYEVYYQPIYNIKKKRFVKTEALLRLYSDKLGYIPTSELVPVLEKIGIIGDIGWFVLEESCKRIKELQKMGIELESINVNISPMQFMQEGFVDRVIDTIEKYKVRPEKLEFEVIESTLIENFDLIEKIMKKLTKYGVNFAIDDFGTGFSALNYIIKLPFSTIKLDKSIVEMVEASPRSQIMVSGLVDLANKLKMQTIAEGVETKSQINMIEKMGCNIIQGYYFAKPVSGDNLLNEIMSM